MERGREILIHSAKRMTGTTSNFTFDMSSQLHGKDYDTLVVLGCSIPTSYYLVLAPYNTFILEENATQVMITVPDGNYNAYAFALIIKDLLDASSTNNLTYKMEFEDRSTETSDGKYEFEVSAFASPVSLIFPQDSDLHEQFGFNRGSKNTFIGQKLTSSTIVQFVAESSVSISTDMTNDGNLISLFHNNVTVYDHITFQNQSDYLYSKPLRAGGPQGIYRFSLLDSNNHELNLNGLEYYIKIKLYKANKTDDKISSYIDFKSDDKKPLLMNNLYSRQ